MSKTATSIGLTAVLLGMAPSMLLGRADVVPVLSDVTREAGLTFRHNSGAFGQKFLPETMGSGAAFLDVDGDGWQDILLLNGTKWPGRPGRTTFSALYRNNGNGTFSDVTRASGLQVELYGLGVAAGDYDNDGLVDIYVTALGKNRLFRNLGGFRFTDVTDAARVGDTGFSTGAMWFDYDRDGRLDLLVLNYVEWSPERDLRCTLDGIAKSYCTPESYKGRSPSLFRNKGDGTFADVTKAAGFWDPASKALGVALIDVENDGWPDVFIANDTQPHRLFRNNRNGTFADIGTRAGVAFSENGTARAGMGVDAADYDRSNRQGVIIGNFSNEMMTLYSNEGNGLFIDEAPSTTIGRATLLSLTFGCFFFDFDLDGWPDILAVNGHVADDIGRVQARVTYAQTPHLFRNLGGRRFEDVSQRVGQAFRQPMVARGAAYADYDLDGDLDVLVTTNNGPARLLRNDAPTTNHRLRVTTVGAVSNRSAIGTRMVAWVAGKAAASATVKSGSSYLSQSELPVTLGLGAATRLSSLRVTWPSGRVEELPAVDGDRHITVVEGKGIVKNIPLGRPRHQ
ncbi:MAG: CRTAC1 family protein [Vicinamibacterales bacterium]